MCSPGGLSNDIRGVCSGVSGLWDPTQKKNNTQQVYVSQKKLYTMNGISMCSPGGLSNDIRGVCSGVSGLWDPAQKKHTQQVYYKPELTGKADPFSRGLGHS